MCARACVRVRVCVCVKTANQRAALWIVLYTAAKRRIRKETQVDVTKFIQTCSFFCVDFTGLHLFSCTQCMFEYDTNIEMLFCRMIYNTTLTYKIALLCFSVYKIRLSTTIRGFCSFAPQIEVVAGGGKNVFCSFGLSTDNLTGFNLFSEGAPNTFVALGGHLVRL